MKVVKISNSVVLEGLTDTEKAQVKKDLTIQNPKYEQIKKYSRYSYTSCSPYLFYFKVMGEGSAIEVPLGYFFNCYSKPENFIIKDERIANRLLFPRFTLTLRKTQEEAVKKYLAMNSKNNLAMNSMCILPTGKGKSVLALFLAKTLGVKTLIVVHKDDLVKGWKADIEKSFAGKADVGLIKQKSRKVGKHFTIATVQTLSRLTEKELEVLYNEFSFVVNDECHHCPSTSFEVVNKFKARYRLGLTATPERSDGLTPVMNFYFGNPFFVFSADENDEDILPVEVIRREVSFSFIPSCRLDEKSGKYKLLPYDSNQRGIKLTNIEYSKRPRIPNFFLDTVVVTKSIESICKDVIEEFKQGHSCVVFFTQKKHCEEYFEYLRHFVGEENIAMYYGDNKDNDSVLEKAKTRRKFITLTTYAKATEGTNVVQWEVAFFASSMANAKNTEQAVGRIRRRGEVEKLDVARVYDYDYRNVYGLMKHFSIRFERYKKLKFKVINSPVSSVFGKGFQV